MQMVFGPVVDSSAIRLRTLSSIWIAKITTCKANLTTSLDHRIIRTESKSPKQIFSFSIPLCPQNNANSIHWSTNRMKAFSLTISGVQTSFAERLPTSTSKKILQLPNSNFVLFHSRVASFTEFKKKTKVESPSNDRATACWVKRARDTTCYCTCDWLNSETTFVSKTNAHSPKECATTELIHQRLIVTDAKMNFFPIWIFPKPKRTTQYAATENAVKQSTKSRNCLRSTEHDTILVQFGTRKILPVFQSTSAMQLNHQDNTAVCDSGATEAWCFVSANSYRRRVDVILKWPSCGALSHSALSFSSSLSLSFFQQSTHSSNVQLNRFPLSNWFFKLLFVVCVRRRINRDFYYFDGFVLVILIVVQLFVSENLICVVPKTILMEIQLGWRCSLPLPELVGVAPLPWPRCHANRKSQYSYLFIVRDKPCDW